MPHQRAGGKKGGFGGQPVRKSEWKHCRTGRQVAAHASAPNEHNKTQSKHCMHPHQQEQEQEQEQTSDPDSEAAGNLHSPGVGLCACARLATSTRMRRPSTSVPVRRSTHACASAVFFIVTKPKPLDGERHRTQGGEGDRPERGQLRRLPPRKNTSACKGASRTARLG
jgi:hypothetical protein